MRQGTPAKLNPYSLAESFDAGTFARGQEYVRQRAVVELWWDATDDSLNGVVRGSNGQVYSTAAYFSPDGGGVLDFDHGLCTCPVGYNCKHCVALALTAIRGTSRMRGQIGTVNDLIATKVDEQPTEPAPNRAGWEQSLDSLLEPVAASGSPQMIEIPLAIELSLVPVSQQPYARYSAAYDPTPKLIARVVQPGKNGGWVSGSLSWSGLDSIAYYGGNHYPARHVGLLRDLYALYRSAVGRNGHYGYDEKTIEMSAIESQQLWPLLDEARVADLRLVRPRKFGPGDVKDYAQAELCLDVRAADPPGSLVITPMIRVDGEFTDAVPIRFIGSNGHGLVYADRAETQRSTDPSYGPFRLAKLTAPTALQLQRMALAAQRLEVPAAEQSRFRESYYPRLRRIATIVSRDESFTPPDISGPTLVLRAWYGEAHALDVGWQWAYQVGDLALRADLDHDAGQGGYRDIDAEQFLLTNLDLPLDRFGLARNDRGKLSLIPHAHLEGIDTMRFTTELLPLLRDQPGLLAEVDGVPADYREASDSLQIGISASLPDGDDSAGTAEASPDWFDLGIIITVDGQQVPFADVFIGLSRGDSHLLLPNGAYFSLDKPELQTLAKLIEEARALQEAPAGDLRISRYQVSLWEELADLGVVSHQAKAWRDQVAGLLSISAVAPLAQPAALLAKLRPYQLEGFGWLAFLWTHKLGGILADDMGLGKTLQSLALICHARHADPDGPPFLIVAPTSVVPNWAAEARRFAPSLSIAAITDTTGRRGQPLREVVAGADAVVTSYTLLRIEFAAYKDLAWSGLILDEAQFTKNHQSKIYQCARKLPAAFKIAITGTPMENNLMELWSLLSITAPGLFPSPHKFREYYARPIEKQNQPELLAQLRRRIKPLVKRRTKEQVAADLPAKQEQVLEVELHPRHRKLYQTHLQRERQKVLGLISDMNANRFTILQSLTLMRQLSLHAGLVDEEQWFLPSSKIDFLIEQLSDVIGGGHRALVFSQFTGFLRFVREQLDAAGIPYCYLDGRTTNRAEVIDRFKSGSIPVFLISLKAGGFGLNLSEADYCFVLDPWWNPATEAQAVDRTHRIGQTRNVMVYRLISRDTIEEKVMALKARKAELFASVIDDGNVFGTSLSAEDIKGLLE